MENINVQNINYIEVPENQEYSPKDQGILNSIFITRNFGLESDYIENHIYSPSNEPLAASYNFINYTVQNTFESTDTYNQMIFTPESDVRAQGINQGTVNSIYYFYRRLFNSSPNKKFIVKTISSDRTELRVILPSVSVDDLQLDFVSWSNIVNTRNYYSDFVLNFSNNLTLIGVNIAFETAQVPTLLIKLYEPLPVQFDVNDTFWLVEEISDPVTFEVTIQQEFVNVVESTQLRGPNITIDIDNKPNLTTGKISLDDIRSTEVTSSFQQLISLFDETSADINIEYEHPDGSTAFENFVHFSSAAERLTNFRYKLTLIEGYQSDIDALGTVVSSPYISQSKAPIQAKIDEIIKNFDNYEYFLYYASSSAAWPKINTFQPFQLYPVSSNEALTWYGDETYGSTYYGGQILSASVYDSNNPNYVWNTMPTYVTTDPQNAIIQNFISLLGQHYDYLWTYVKAVTDIQSGDNRLEHGISKDLVSAALQSFGIKLYTTNRNTEDLYTSLLGITPSGSLLPSTGSYLITDYITASAQTTPDSDIVAETYKRIYHNLPYLLKAKGTYNGLRALMNCYGIPPTLLRVDEYGGNIKTTSSVETYFERFSYETVFNGTGSINVPWLPSMAQFIDTGNPNIMPDAIEFRLKTPGIPSSDITEPVFQVGTGSDFRFGIQLSYSQSYNNFVSGTINVPGSPYYQQRLGSNFQEYGLLRLVMSGSQGYCYSDPVYLPFFNNKWWSVLLYRENPAVDNVTSNTYWLVAKNSIYTGEDGSSIGFQASSSIYVMGAISSSYNNSWNYYNPTPVVSSSQIPLDAYLGGTGSNNILAPNGITFNGSFQDLRYWRKGLDLDAFNKHVLNPMSIQNAEFSGSNDAYNDLIFRLGLGNDLLYTPDGFNYTGSFYNIDPYGNAYYVTASYTASLSYLQSIHPAVTGTVEPTASFIFPRDPLAYNIDLYNVGTYQLVLSGTPGGVWNGTSYNGSYYLGSTTYDLFTFSFGRNNSGSNAGTTYDALQTAPNVGAISPVDDKVRIINQNLVPGDTLSPFVSITQPLPITPDFPYLDVSLSPQNSIDYDIINQMGYWNIDEYIGDPKDAQSRDYQKLTLLRNYYFKKYISAYNFYDIMRLLSYFDSALFKMIKDWVPGRAALAAGIVIRPNLLERNKTQRFEPEFTTGSNYTGSIDMVDISGSYGFQEDRIDVNTDFENAAFFVPNGITFNTSSGIYTYEVTDQRPLYTGQYGGSEIVVYSQPTSSMVMEINKLDMLDIPDAQEIAIATTYSVLPFLPELNLVQQARTTNKQLDVDYSSNPNVAVNNTYIVDRFQGKLTGSTVALPDSQLALVLSADSSSFLNAPIQDSNYTAYSSVNPRYLGSKLIGAQYNTYSVGDISYGSDPVINKNSIYFAYFKEVFATGSSMKIDTGSSSPYISNVYIKYLIDADSNVLELTKQNKNLFPIQEIYNNQQAVISLFNNQQPSNQKFLDGLKNIYAGGFKYTPILYNPLGQSSLTYNLTASLIINYPAAGEQSLYTSASAASTLGNIISNPYLSNNTYLSSYINGGWPYYNSGYYVAATSISPTFTISRAGDLLTTYLGNALNVYVAFTASFQFIANGTNYYVDADAYLGGAGYEYGYVTSGSYQGSKYKVEGIFSGSTIVNIPANTPSITASPLYPFNITIYSNTSQYLFTTASVSNTFPTVQLYDGSSTMPASAITRQATSQITLIISGATDTGINPGSTPDTFFYLSTGSNGTYRHLTGSDSMSVYFGQFIQSQSVLMSQSGYEAIDETFQIKQGDLFRFFNKESNQWDRSFEREVKNVFIPTTNQYSQGQRLVIEFDENIDPRSCKDWTSDADNDTAYQISKFIVMRKVPDETNVTLDYQKQPGLTSDGIIIPADAPASLRDEAGNIVKQLKAQNLI